MKSSHLNVTKNIANAVGSQMSMQSSIFGRIGICSEFYHLTKPCFYAEPTSRGKPPSLAIWRALSSMLRGPVSH